ncbi:hypothetical protein POTOM_039008 [Populus tomentosa]|uniref:Pentatricopeptide repeat-containing protein n=1 Tax=Populus tomentosa TaxID=118781 RepID=A0A8X8CLT5_POPTO|nr:hypothetical protein POTOM_039008 [Populus tomentosa]
MNNIQDATSLFKEFIDRGLKPDTVTYTALLSGYCKTNNTQVATSLFKQINDSGLEPDSVAYTALLSGYCSMGGIDMATTLVNGMKDKRIQPDSHAKHEGGMIHHQLDHLFSGEVEREGVVFSLCFKQDSESVSGYCVVHRGFLLEQELELYFTCSNLLYLARLSLCSVHYVSAPLVLFGTRFSLKSGFVAAIYTEGP